jgi:hypothetical protein
MCRVCDAEITGGGLCDAIYRDGELYCMLPKNHKEEHIVCFKYGSTKTLVHEQVKWPNVLGIKNWCGKR